MVPIGPVPGSLLRLLTAPLEASGKQWLYERPVLGQLHWHGLG
jgi:hypothetical protein